MIEKILIVEDHESMNLAVQKIAEDLKIPQVDYAYYCDDAFRKIEIAKQRGALYDVLMTDLYFDFDGEQQEIKSGFELIRKAREVQPDLGVIVFSAEKGESVINRLIQEYQIDAYVRKARNDAKELKKAFQAVDQRKQYFPPYIARNAANGAAFEFSAFDLQVIRLLAQGYQQNQIPDYLKKNNIKPSSLSSIEKRLNRIREQLGYSKNEQVVLFCKDAGLL